MSIEWFVDNLELVGVTNEMSLRPLDCWIFSIILTRVTLNLEWNHLRTVSGNRSTPQIQHGIGEKIELSPPKLLNLLLFQITGRLHSRLRVIAIVMSEPTPANQALLSFHWAHSSRETAISRYSACCCAWTRLFGSLVNRLGVVSEEMNIPNWIFQLIYVHQTPVFF